MPAYRRKLEVIDAMQLTGPDSANAIVGWSQGLITAPPILDPQPDNPTGLYLTFEAERFLVGDWIVRRPNSTFRGVKPDEFERTYVEGDAQNDLPKTASNPFGIERRKVDTGAPERRGLSGRSTDALRREVQRLTSENARLTGLINTAVTSLQVLKGQG